MHGPASPSPPVRFRTRASEWRRDTCSPRGLPRAVFTENAAQHAAAFTDRHIVRERGLERRHQVVGSPRRTLELSEVPLDRGLRTPRAQLLQGPRLRDLVARADLHDLDGPRIGFGVTIDTDHDALTRFDPALQAVGAVGDAALRPAGLDAADRAAHLV